MHYDVLTEPWIPVRKMDGTMTKQGVREVLYHAQDYKEISMVSPMQEFGIYRFLFTFLMDAYHPETRDDIAFQIDKGKFEPEVIDQYISECQKTGNCFDLFDGKHPFMQVPRIAWADEKAIKSVAYLDPTVPTGNNPVHFDHIMQADREISPAEAAAALCAVSVFCTAGVQGYPSGVNGAPPVYTIVKGENLFKTLLFGMISEEWCENYSAPGPFWRCEHPETVVVEKQKIPKTSLLFGLTIPARKITLIPEGNGKIRKIYYAQGLNFQGYNSWRDPYITYLTNAKGERGSLKPDINKANWRNLGSIYDESSSAPEVIRQYTDISNDTYVKLNTYHVATNQASYLDEQKGSYSLSRGIVTNPIRMDALKNSLKDVENYSTKLKDSIDRIYKILQDDKKAGAKKGIGNAEKEIVTKEYYFFCRNLFMNQVCVQLDDNTLDINELCSKWNNEFFKLFLQEYDHFVDLMSFRGRTLIVAEKIKVESYGGKR